MLSMETWISVETKKVKSINVVLLNENAGVVERMDPGRKG